MGLPSANPLGIEISRAEGIYMYDKSGKEYIDLVSGVSVSNIGHLNPRVVEAIKGQLEKYMHLMVYGEYIQSPQVKLAKELTSKLPDSLDSVFFVNSGSEAIEGALKLAKRFTGRTELVSFKKAYHGGTHGALSIFGGESLRYSFRPLLPDTRQLEFNNFEDISLITENSACVVVEAIQAEAGIILPSSGLKVNVSIISFDDINAPIGIPPPIPLAIHNISGINPKFSKLNNFPVRPNPI